MFGKSRQAYYEHIWLLHDHTDQENLDIEMVGLVRRELPGLGYHKLYKCPYTPFKSKDITFGRDRLNIVLRKYKMLIEKKRSNAPELQISNHYYLRCLNLIKNLAPTKSSEIWVSDITYISVRYDFRYLWLITDAYSRKIIGYYLHPQFSIQGAINALKNGLEGKTSTYTLIYHSDRGVQYCSFEYTLR